MITGRVVKLFNGPLTADTRTEWLDCTNAIYVVFRVLVRNFSGFTSITPRIEGAFEDPKGAVALASDDLLQTTSIPAITGNGPVEISFTNARQNATVLIVPNMSINLDVIGAGSADVIVYAFIQEDIGS